MRFRIAGPACIGLSMLLLAGCSGSGSESGNELPGGVTGPRTGVWLSGDLHLHSDHSTDAADNPMTALIDEAEARGMGYFVVTDHDNHVNGVLTTWDDPAYRSDSMLMLYGVEYTTARGHANFFGANRFDHLAMYALRDRSDDAAGADIADAVHRQGLHFSVNHPVNGDPWEFGYDFRVDSMEVWNALHAFPTDNTAATLLWDSLLASGRRIGARGGSDCHHQTGIEALGLNVGNPTTWVYAAAPTANAVIAALNAGNASISYAPTAERIELTADADRDGGFEMLMGDNQAARGQPVDFRVDIIGARPLALYDVSVLKNGETLLRRNLIGESRLAFQDTPVAGERSYYRVEVRGSTPEAPTLASLVGFYGGFIGMTNPLYFGFD